MLCPTCGTTITACLTEVKPEDIRLRKKVECHVCGFSAVWHPELVLDAVVLGKAPGPPDPTWTEGAVQPPTVKVTAHQIGQS